MSIADVKEVQKKWADAIVHISKTHEENGDFVGEALKAAGELYAYGHSDHVLFKPTKTTKNRFRPTAGGALSYFVGAHNVKDEAKAEDQGFAINNGKHWNHCEFNNHEIVIKGAYAIAMGIYTFTCDEDETDSQVEYTFGYQKCKDGKVRIFLHHSSVPFTPVADHYITESPRHSPKRSPKLDGVDKLDGLDKMLDQLK